jgi:hypothetical protein
MNNEEGEVDLDCDASSDKGSTFPEGDYYLKCTDVTSLDKTGNQLKSKKSGNPQFILEMSVSEGQYTNRKIWNYLTFIPKGQPGHGMVLRCLHAFGLPHDGPVKVKPADFIDVVVKARVTVEESVGYDPKNVIKKFYVPEGEEQREPVGASAAPVSAPAKKGLPWGKR